MPGPMSLLDMAAEVQPTAPRRVLSAVRPYNEASDQAEFKGFQYCMIRLACHRVLHQR